MSENCFFFLKNFLYSYNIIFITIDLVLHVNISRGIRFYYPKKRIEIITTYIKSYIFLYVFIQITSLAVDFKRLQYYNE